MRLLLDTHVVLWWLGDDPTLSAEIKASIDDEPAAYVSPVTIWEVAIKQSLGKIKAPSNVVELIRDAGFTELPIRFDHAIVAGRLPAIHRDPFDRMLVAQASVDDLTLVTRDSAIRQYDVQVLVV